ncbi:hypothetical protein CSA17_05975 [bacterium DOLJORAL78_65_58]|nr:MAG: hypothetical protein CSB20_07695 [bacterium DOLZORAL124_64_63]PIE75728.1 MAG: hypothetical protein CSA17_05975 [bacterium DOLJORAL78_65_58]
MLRSLNFWLLILLLVCGVSFWSASGGMDKLRSKPVIVEEEDQEPAPPVRLRILNGAGVNGLAQDISLLVAGRGCLVEEVGNADGHWSETVLVNRRLDDGQARALAAQLGGVPLLSQWDARCSEDAVLILGADHSRLREFLATRPGSDSGAKN